MYASKNFPTKTAFKKVVATLYAPGLGKPVENGTESVAGPWSPKPHSWYANVMVTKVK